MFRACERLGVTPPGVTPEWDNNDVWSQALILAYNDIRSQEEFEEFKTELKASGAKLK